eukprot:contig_7730_g1816
MTVFSKTPAEHLEHLREVLALSSKAGVTLKAEKCNPFETEVKYLGQVLSPGELRVNEKNIKALRKAQHPKIQTELKSLLAEKNQSARVALLDFVSPRRLTNFSRRRIPDGLQHALKSGPKVEDEFLDQLELLLLRVKESIAKTQERYKRDYDEGLRRKNK